MAASLALNGLPVGVALAVRAEPFSAALATRSWSIRQKAERRAHLLLLQSDRGRASWQGTEMALAAPTLLWLPGNVDASVEVSAGAHGFLLSMDDDFLIKIVTGNAEALHLRRTTERVALIGSEALAPHLDAIAQSCRAIAAELRTPGYGGATLISAYLLLLCLQLWRRGHGRFARRPSGGRTCCCCCRIAAGPHGRGPKSRSRRRRCSGCRATSMPRWK